MMFIFKFLLFFVGIAIIGTAIVCFFAELFETFGMGAGLAGAAIIFLVFKNEAFVSSLGITMGLVEDIAFGAMIGGGFICTAGLEKIGGAMITAGWVAVGLILMQVIPIPFISNLIDIITIPFTVAMVPLLLILLFFISLYN